MLDQRDKDIVEDRIIQALRLDYPNQVEEIKKGFYIPFHSKDA